MQAFQHICRSRPKLQDTPQVPLDMIIPIEQGIPYQVNFRGTPKRVDRFSKMDPPSLEQNIYLDLNSKLSETKKAQEFGSEINKEQSKENEECSSIKSKDSILFRDQLMPDSQSSPKMKPQQTGKPQKYQEMREWNNEFTSETSSQLSKNFKELGSQNQTKQKKPSHEKAEYYDLGKIGTFKNYKYTKFNLANTELSFLADKPLDLGGKSFPFQHSKISSYRNTEIALENQKKKKDMLEDESDFIWINQNNLNTPVQQEIKSQLQSKILSSIEKVYPFEQKQKIAKSLRQLDQQIQEKNNFIIGRQLSSAQSFSKLRNSSAFKSSNNFPFLSDPIENNNNNSSRYSLNSSHFFSKGSMSSQQLKRTPQWISPLLRHEVMRSSFNGSDSILKHELIKKPKTSQDSRNANFIGTKMITFNKALKGKGSKMSSIIDKIGSRNPMINMPAGEIVKTLNKKSQYYRIVEEYNRLLELDKNRKALSKTRRIKTKISLKIDEGIENMIGDQQFSLSANVFIEETIFFKECLRKESEIVDRIVYAIKNNYNAIQFENYMNFYQIFVFENTPQDILTKFVAKLLLYNKHQIIQKTTLSDLLETLRQLASHPTQKDAKNIMDNWEIALQNTNQISYDQEFHIKESHIKFFIAQKIFDINIILQLLFL